MRNLISIIFFTFILLSCGNKAAQQSEQTSDNSIEKQEVKDTSVVYENNYLVKVGDIAPDFTLPLTNGTTFTLSQNRGKVVMLQFTASWCGVCRKEMPFIERDIWLPNKDNENFVLVGIDREEPIEDVKKFAQTTGISYPIVLDSNADVFASYAERKSGITRNILIDRDGRIVKLTRLFNEQEFKELVEAIDSLLKK
ncbi:MAG: TlpA family protein disulfide reductase [Bacteroidaceae bacterium]|nr:TlpA family protein disulfide reductase [Bacteroidaceae bacterium]